MMSTSTKGLVLTAIVMAAGAAHATSSDLGIALDGSCVAGTCNNPTVATDPTETLSYSQEIKLADGDVYGVAVQLSRTLSPLTGQRYIKVEYLGNDLTGTLTQMASGPDTLTLDMIRAWPTASGNFTTDMGGSLSAGLADGSSLSVKIGDPTTHQTVADYGSFSTSGPFSETLKYQLAVNNGTGISDARATFAFANGSQVGSYFVMGAPIPEPGTWALMILGIPAVAWASRRKRPR